MVNLRSGIGCWGSLDWAWSYSGYNLAPSVEFLFVSGLEYALFPVESRLDDVSLAELRLCRSLLLSEVCGCSLHQSSNSLSVPSWGASLHSPPLQTSTSG